MPNDRPTVRSAYKDRPASVPLMGGTAIGAFLAIAVFGTAMLFLSLWWFKWRVNAEGEIRRDSFTFQETAREQVVDFGGDLAAIDTQLTEPSLTAQQKAALTAQRKAIVDQMCVIAADITGETSVIVGNLIAEEC